MSLLAFLQAKKYSGSGRVHVAPNIPKKQLSNALAAYKLTLDPSDVLVLIDDTMFGSGKDGCLIARDCLAIREAFSDAVTYSYDEVQSLELEGSKLFVNKRKTMSFNMPDKAELSQCFALVLEWLRSQPLENESSAPPVETPEAFEAEVITALAVIEDSGVIPPAEQQNKASAKDKLLGYVAVAIEQNKSRILPFIKEKTGEASLAALRDDTNIEKLGGIIYAFLPGVVRLALKEEAFVRFVLDNRNKLLDKLLTGEAEPVAALANTKPAVSYHAELDDLLMDDEPAVQPGQKPIQTLQAILQELQQDQREDPDAAFIWQLPIGFLEALIAKTEKLIGFPDKKVEDQAFFALALMYGFSIHKVPEAVRSQETVFETFLNGFGVICSSYEERNPISRFNAEDDVLPMLLVMTKVASKQQLNDMVRTMLDEHTQATEPGDLAMDDIMFLLREANNGAVAWVDALTRISVEREREVQNKWGDVFS